MKREEMRQKLKRLEELESEKSNLADLANMTLLNGVKFSYSDGTVLRNTELNMSIKQIAGQITPIIVLFTKQRIEEIDKEIIKLEA